MTLEKSANTDLNALSVKDKLSSYLEATKLYLADALKLKEVVVKDLLGVDINANFIKILKIDNSHSPATIEILGVVNTPAKAIVGNDIKDATSIANVIKKLIKDQNINYEHVAFSIPRASTIIKILNVNNRLTTDEIESRVLIEANRLFPNLVGEIYLDFYVAGTSAQDKNQLEVVLIACRKDQINPYLEVLNQAELKPAIIDIDTYAMERALAIIIKESPPRAIWAMLNINFNLISLLVMHDGNLIYSHELSYNGSYLMDKAARNEPITNEELQMVLGLHLRHSLQFFYSSRPNIRVDDLLIAGDVPSRMDLCTFIENEVGKKTVLANPFSRMKAAPGVNTDLLTSNAAGLMLCCGLAMSKVITE